MVDFRKLHKKEVVAFKLLKNKNFYKDGKEGLPCRKKGCKQR